MGQEKGGMPYWNNELNRHGKWEMLWANQTFPTRTTLSWCEQRTCLGSVGFFSGVRILLISGPGLFVSVLPKKIFLNPYNYLQWIYFQWLFNTRQSRIVSTTCTHSYHFILLHAFSSLFSELQLLYQKRKVINEKWQGKSFTKEKQPENSK